MPAPKWLLSHFIATTGAGSVGVGAMRSWLLGLELWHIVNLAPWLSAGHLKCASQGTHSCAPASTTSSQCPPITISHLLALKAALNLNDTFDAAVWAIATIAFWCQCHLSEVCINYSFDPSIHPARSTPQKSGKTASNVPFHSFWAPSTKTKPHGKFIMWMDSGDASSAEWAFINHIERNSHAFHHSSVCLRVVNWLLPSHVQDVVHVSMQ